MGSYAEELRQQGNEGGGGQAGGEFAPDLGVAAQGQADELAGGAGAGGDAASQQSEEAKEAERVAAAKKSWEQFLGAKIGGKLFELVQENVSYEDLLGYAQDGTKAMADSLKGGVLKPTEAGAAGGLMDEQSEADAVNALIAALAPALKGAVDSWLESDSGKRLLTGISQWVEEHPKTVTSIVGGALIAAAVGAYLANMDPGEFEKTFDLGAGFKAGGGVDIGPIQQLTVQAVSATLQYETEGFSAKISAKHDLEKDQTTANASVAGQGQVGNTKLNGQADVALAGDGRTTVKINGGIETMLGNRPAALTAGATHGSGGGAPDQMKVQGKFTLGESGEQHTAEGWYDAANDAFSFTLARTFLEGAGSMSHNVARDGDGNVSTTRTAGMDMGEQGKISVSDKTSPQGDGATVRYQDDDVAGSGVKLDASAGTGTEEHLKIGAGYDIGKFKNSLDLEMRNGVNTLGIKSTAQLDDEWSLGANLDVNLSESRVDQIGAKLGWKDPDAFRSFTLEYKGQWMADNPGYNHGFDAAFEYATGNLSGRITAGADVHSRQGLQGARVDALAGYKLNNDWALIGGGGYTADRNDLGGMDQGWNARAGVQYKGVAVTGGYDGGRDQAFIRLEIPLGW